MKNFLIILILGLTHSITLAQTEPTQGFIDPAFEVVVDSARIERLRQRTKALNDHYIKLLAGVQQQSNATDLATALAGLALPSNPRQFRKRYQLEIEFSQSDRGTRRWLKVAQGLLPKNRPLDAQTAASQAYDLANNPLSKAKALAIMGEAAVALKEPLQAVNLYHLAVKLGRDKGHKQRLAAITTQFELRVIDVKVDVEQKLPNACIVFSQILAKPLPIKARDYLKFATPLDVKISANGNRICIHGLSFGTQREVTILAGVPGRDGGRLYQDVVKQISVGDRRPQLKLGSGTYLLPKTGNPKLPLKSINSASAKLRLYHIHDRGLAPFLHSGLMHSDLNQYTATRIANTHGALIWSGAVDIKFQPNIETTTLIPVQSIMVDRQPGLYALVALPVEKTKTPAWESQHTQWLVVSDIGLTTFSGTHGLQVFARSLASAEAIAGLKLRLVARNNTVLGTTITDAAGSGIFSSSIMRGTGGTSAAMLVAESADGDYAFLALQGAALDLSDRGSSGRYSPGSLDAYFFSERGVYRPGERVYITGMLRDNKAMAVANVPLQITLKRPDGVAAAVKTVKGNDLGGYSLSHELSAAARSGQWSVRIVAGDASITIGQTSFQVEDFVPERIAASVSSDKTVVVSEQPLEVRLQADFLYGVPAAGIKGQIKTSFIPNSIPHPKFKKFQFGLVQDPFKPQSSQSTSFKTDAGGSAHIALTFETLPDTTYPLQAKILAEVQDVGGRPVYALHHVPVQMREFDIGLRNTRQHPSGKAQDSHFEIVTLSPSGQVTPHKKLTVHWVKEHYSYSWYRTGERWKYRTSIIDETFAEESLISDELGATTVSRRLLPGQYRLEVSHSSDHNSINSASPIASSIRFNVGWWSNHKSIDVPDALQVNLEQTAMTNGETLNGFIKAPFKGKALITVVNEHVLTTQEIDLPESGAKFSIPVDADWGPSAYVLATAFRPEAGIESRLPVRAMGLAWFSIDRAMRDLQLSLELPATVTPRQTIDVPIAVSGSLGDKKINVTLAAVDEGILRLTDYPLPNPGAHYFAKKSLGLDIRDLYGRLIRTEAGQPGQVRSGAGAHSRKQFSGNTLGTQRRSTRTVALYQGTITLDAQGKGNFKLAIPDFTGSLKVMAVAYGSSGVGQAQADLIVRDPIVAELLLPRFLAPGDRARAVLSVQNLTPRLLAATVSITSDSPIVSISQPRIEVSLAPGERVDLPVPITAETQGPADISLWLTASGLAPIKRRWQLSVRPAWPLLTQRKIDNLAAGESIHVAFEQRGQMLPGSLQNDLAVSVGPNLDPRRMMFDLNRYAYWCSEQTVSKAFAALLYPSLATQYALQWNTNDAGASVDQAIIRLADRQKANGSFGVWSVLGYDNPWLNVYVTDFLIRARELGHRVPDAVLNLSLNALKKLNSQRSKRALNVKAYALYVLARLGEVHSSQLRYFTEQFGPNISSPLGLGHLAAALAVAGEKGLAKELFIRAIAQHRTHRVKRYHYGSLLRDGAALIALISETLPDSETLGSLSDALEVVFEQRHYFSTQEMGWILRATGQLIPSDQSKISLLINGDPVAVDGLQWQLSQTDKAQIDKDDGVTLTNQGQQSLKIIHTVRGYSAKPPVPSSNGFDITRKVYDFDGRPVSLEKIHQNDRYVVLIQGRAQRTIAHDALIVDLLPAGLEIEDGKFTPGKQSELPFLPSLTQTEFTAARDDRFIAAVNLGPGYQRRGSHFAVAYIVRAVTPGQFTQPGVFIEDMYRPHYRANGVAGDVVIEP